MSVSRHPIPYTYEDYKSLTESSDQRYELIDGDLYMTPSPSVRHQTVSMKLASLLQQHIGATRCGRVLSAPLDVALGTGEQRCVVQPDILFVSNDRAGIVAQNEIAGAPDLVVEILSSGTAQRDRRLKKALYARSGVSEYWIVDPEFERVEVFLLSGDGYSEPRVHESADRLVAVVVPGFELPVAELFRDPS